MRGAAGGGRTIFYRELSAAIDNFPSSTALLAFCLPLAATHRVNFSKSVFFFKCGCKVLL